MQVGKIIYQCGVIVCFEFVKVRVIYNMGNDFVYIKWLMQILWYDVVKFLCWVVWGFYWFSGYCVGFFMVQVCDGIMGNLQCVVVVIGQMIGNV